MSVLGIFKNYSQSFSNFIVMFNEFRLVSLCSSRRLRHQETQQDTGGLQSPQFYAVPIVSQPMPAIPAPPGQSLPHPTWDLWTTGWSRLHRPRRQRGTVRRPRDSKCLVNCIICRSRHQKTPLLVSSSPRREELTLFHLFQNFIVSNHS